MVIDAIVGFLAGIFEWFIGLLPEWDMPIDPVTPITSRLLEVDSLVPIAGPIVVMAYLAPFALVFITIRLVVFVRNMVLP